MRIGLGIDVHRLIHDSTRPLMLGGIVIPSEWALEGHSDADALLHAITDAILGALGLGDIGEYFPNTDARWKNAKSEIFLRHALDAMRQRGYVIGNIDCVIVAESPKLSPHRSAIRAQLAEWLEVEAEAIGLKATTSEQLGALGRGEGLLAQAVVLLERESLPVPPALKTAVENATRTKKMEPPKREVEPTDVKGQTVQVWTDGASRGNPGPSSIGVVVKSMDGGLIHAAGQTIGEVTNNVAEYRALIYALQLCLALSPSKVEVHMDSELIIKQMKGEYRVKDATLQKLYAQAVTAAEMLPAVIYRHVRREQNREADRLANQALDGEL